MKIEKNDRRRKCLPRGASCIGADKEYRFCQDLVCPYWDQWSSWGGCSVTCGIGTCERRRKCIKDDGTALPNIEEIIADANRENDLKSAAKATLIESSRTRQRNRGKPFSEEASNVYQQKDITPEILVVSSL
uniref:TSP1_spondin domain-containing protein n=1 Tax=Ascaris lumbricoides TaxID=6252 RepID=A0A0M3HHT1_ASCLU